MLAARPHIFRTILATSRQAVCVCATRKNERKEEREREVCSDTLMLAAVPGDRYYHRFEVAPPPQLRPPFLPRARGAARAHPMGPPPSSRTYVSRLYVLSSYYTVQPYGMCKCTHTWRTPAPTRDAWAKSRLLPSSPESIVMWRPTARPYRITYIQQRQDATTTTTCSASPERETQRASSADLARLYRWQIYLYARTFRKRPPASPLRPFCKPMGAIIMPNSFSYFLSFFSDLLLHYIIRIMPCTCSFALMYTRIGLAVDCRCFYVF